MIMTDEQQDLAMDIISDMVSPPDLDHERNMSDRQRQARDDARTWAQIMAYTCDEIRKECLKAGRGAGEGGACRDNNT